MSLTKRDFEAIAREVNLTIKQLYSEEKSGLNYAAERNRALHVALSYVWAVGEGLSTTNPKFDQDRFMDACWIGLPEFPPKEV